MGQSKAIGYIRVSKAREEMISPELQHAAISDWCKRANIPLLDTVSDLDATGRNFARAGVQALIARVEAGEADTVVVWKWSRFGRNMRDCLINIDRLEAAGGRLVAATEDFDDTPVGRFGRGQFLLMAEFESARIGEQWKEAKARRLRQGLPKDGVKRFGYRYQRETRSYVIVPEEAEAIRDAVDLYCSGMGFARVVDELNARGLPSPSGKGWYYQSLIRTLDRGFPAGYIWEAHTRTYHPGSHEPILDAATWEKYLRKRRSNATVFPRHLTPTHPFAGLLVCGSCGKAVTRQGRRDRNVMRCRARSGEPSVCPKPVSIALPTVEASVLTWLEGVAASVNARAEVRREEASTRRRAKADTTRLAREAVRLEGVLSRLSRQVAEGLVPVETYAATRDSLLADLQRVRGAQQRLEDEKASAASQEASRALDLIGDWGDLGTVGQREVLRALVARIEVLPGTYRTGEPRVRIVPRWAE